MHADIEAALEEHGFVTRPQLFGRGFDDRSIAAALRDQRLCRVGPGLYAHSGYAAMSAEDQHVLRCHAVATRFDGAVAFSHQSAALIHGLPVWGMDLRQLHVTRLDGGRGRLQAGVFHHVGQTDPSEITHVAGLPVTGCSRTVWDIAYAAPVESALVTVDAALNRGIVSAAALREIISRYPTWPGARRTKVVLTLSDEAAESPGESRIRYAMRDAGIPRPETQFKIFDTDGTLLAITDFAWPEWHHVLEFDGLMKYGNNADLAKEKAREDRLRALGWGVTRVIWSQLSPNLRRPLLEEIQAAMSASRRQFRRSA